MILWHVQNNDFYFNKISNNLKQVFTKFLKYLFHIHLYRIWAPFQIGLNPYTFYSTTVESTSNAHNTQMLGQRLFCGNRKNHLLDSHFLNNYPHILKTGNINYWCFDDFLIIFNQPTHLLNPVLNIPFL